MDVNLIRIKDMHHGLGCGYELNFIVGEMLQLVREATLWDCTMLCTNYEYSVLHRVYSLFFSVPIRITGSIYLQFSTKLLIYFITKYGRGCG